MNNHFYITRHGQSQWNVEQKVAGATDVPLTEEGKKQAIELAEKIIKEKLVIDEIWYSPLERAKITALTIGERTGIPCKEEVALKEQNFGKWEGFFWGDKTVPDFINAKARFADNYENGESMLKLGQRVFNFLDKLKEVSKTKTILLVTHGGIARMVNAYFNSTTNEEFATFGIHNCQILEYKF